jgi:hypothetical protein
MKGKRGEYGNFYYEVETNGIMNNLGLRYKLGQLNLNDYKNDKSI